MGLMCRISCTRNILFTLAYDAYEIGKAGWPQKLSHGNTLLAKIIQIGSNGVKIGHGSVSGIQTRARFLAVNDKLITLAHKRLGSMR